MNCVWNGPGATCRSDIQIYLQRTPYKSKSIKIMILGPFGDELCTILTNFPLLPPTLILGWLYCVLNTNGWDIGTNKCFQIAMASSTIMFTKIPRRCVWKCSWNWGGFSYQSCNCLNLWFDIHVWKKWTFFWGLILQFL